MKKPSLKKLLLFQEMELSSPKPEKKKEKKKIKNYLGLDSALGRCTHLEKISYGFPKKNSSRISRLLLIKT